MNALVLSAAWAFAAFLMAYGAMTIGGTPERRRKKLALITGGIVFVYQVVLRTMGVM